MRGLIFRSQPENGSIPSRAIAKISRELAAAATTISANIENTTIARNTRVSPGPSQYSAIAASGTGEAWTSARSGIAAVKPTSAIMPSTPDTTSERIIMRGTARRASIGLLGHVGSGLEPDEREHADQRAADQRGHQRLVGGHREEEAEAVPVRRAAAHPGDEHDDREHHRPDDLREHRDVVHPRRELHPHDVDQVGDDEREHGEEHQQAAVLGVEAEHGGGERGQAEQRDARQPDGAVEHAQRADDVAEAGVDQPRRPLVVGARERHVAGELGEHEHDEQLADRRHGPQPHRGRTHLGEPVGVVQEDPRGDGDDRERDREQREAPQHAGKRGGVSEIVHKRPPG